MVERDIEGAPRFGEHWVVQAVVLTGVVAGRAVLGARVGLRVLLHFPCGCKESGSSIVAGWPVPPGVFQHFGSWWWYRWFIQHWSWHFRFRGVDNQGQVYFRPLVSIEFPNWCLRVDHVISVADKMPCFLL